MFQRHKDEVQNWIIQLEKHFDAKQTLELEIEQLRELLTARMITTFRFPIFFYFFCF